MKREGLEARFVEILSAGGEPMDDPEIREAVAADADLAAELEHLREFVLKLDDMQWPELDDSRGIDRMTEAFEEGFRQGRTHAAQVLPRTSWLTSLGKMWQFAAAATAVFVGVVAGGYVWSNMNSGEQVADLRTDMQNLEELVAVSMLENQSASDRLRGVQYARNVSNPGPRLIHGLSSTLRSDRNANVRLAAAEAIARYADRQDVRDALHETVLKEDPFMQVQLIDVLLVVQGRDPKTEDVLNRLVNSPGVTEVVRLKATAALNEMGDIQ